MRVERNKIKLSFYHPYALTVSSATCFKNVNLILDAMDIPLPDKINLQKKVGEIIYSDLRKNITNGKKNRGLIREGDKSIEARK